MNNFIRIFIAVFLTNFFLMQPLLASIESLSIIDHIDPIVEEALLKFNIPGAAIGIVQGDQIHVQGYGYRNLAKHCPVTPQTVFPIASCTKAFTSFLIGQLVDEGKLAWDDPVIKHLPEFRLFSPELTNSVTIRDLLAHRTGIERHDVIWVCNKVLQIDMLKLLPHLKPKHELREQFLYNNFMYAVAGMIVERVTGQKWSDVLYARLLQPLKMKQTILSLDDLQKCRNHSQPYVEMDGVVQEIPFREFTSSKSPFGGINSNVEDMVKWIQLHLSEGRLSNHTFISPNSLQEMHSIHLSAPQLAQGDPTETNGIGLGWFVGSFATHPLIHHGGCIDGFFSDVVLLPHQKIGWVILTNSSSDGIHFITYMRNRILDYLKGDFNKDRLSEELQKRQHVKDTLKAAMSKGAKQNPSRSLQDYVGIYEHPAYGIVKVFQQNEKLYAAYGDNNTKLTYNSDDGFQGYFGLLLYYGFNPNIDYTFIRDDLGNICELHIPFESFRMGKPIPFKKLPANK